MRKGRVTAHKGHVRAHKGRIGGAYGASSLFVLGYHWLPLATTDLVGDNREFEI